MHVIEAEGLVKRYGRATALAGLDLAVPEGTVLGLLGPNGAGTATAVFGGSIEVEGLGAGYREFLVAWRGSGSSCVRRSRSATPRSSSSSP